VLDVLEPAAAEPNLLRDSVVRALLSIPELERSVVRERLLGELKKAGLKVRQCLLMLGVAAATAEELTAPEIAALIRYVRLAEPKVMMAIAAPLTELLTTADPGAKLSGRAA
jgi:hypothetical protein